MGSRKGFIREEEGWRRGTVTERNVSEERYLYESAKG